jgi:hypothetical protein
MSLETRQKERRNRRVERVSWATDVPPRDSWQRLLMEALGERGPLACAWAHEMYAVDRGLWFIGLATRAIAHAIDALCGAGLALAFGAFVVLGTSQGADVYIGVPVLLGMGSARAVRETVASPRSCARRCSRCRWGIRRRWVASGGRRC